MGQNPTVMSGLFAAFVVYSTLATAALGRCLSQASPVYGGLTPPAPVYAGVPPVYGGQCALRFQKCGGDASYTGPTSCCGANVCTVSNPSFSMCLATPLPANIAAEGQKCAGRDWQGPYTCEPLTECVFIDETYSLCKSVIPSPPPPTESPVSPPPAPESPPSPPTPPPSPASPVPPAPIVPAPEGFNASACAFRWEACGGEGVPDRCCHGDNVCTVESKWFSSCQASPLPADVQREWGRCNMPGYPSACEKLTSCVQISDQERQCRSIFPGTPAPPSPELPPRADGLARRWTQCAGLVFNKKCEPGSVCVKQNMWWSQCEPGPVPEGTKRVNESCGSASKPEPCEIGSTCTAVDQWWSVCKADE